MSIEQRLVFLESRLVDSVPRAPAIPERCTDCGFHLLGFTEPYGPQNWSSAAKRCEDCALAHVVEILGAAEEAGFTLRSVLEERADEVGLSAREVLEAALQGEGIAGRDSDIVSWMIHVGCVLSRGGVDPLDH